MAEIQAKATPREPLQPGTIISYCGEEATVVEDHGGNDLIVDSGDGKMKWYWRIYGEECQVVKLPGDDEK